MKRKEFKKLVKECVKEVLLKEKIKTYVHNMLSENPKKQGQHLVYYKDTNSWGYVQDPKKSRGVVVDPKKVQQMRQQAPQQPQQQAPQQPQQQAPQQPVQRRKQANSNLMNKLVNKPIGSYDIEDPVIKANSPYARFADETSSEIGKIAEKLGLGRWEDYEFHGSGKGYDYQPDPETGELKRQYRGSHPQENLGYSYKSTKERVNHAQWAAEEFRRKAKEQGMDDATIDKHLEPTSPDAMKTHMKKKAEDALKFYVERDPDDWRLDNWEKNNIRSRAEWAKKQLKDPNAAYKKELAKYDDL
jgi:hypothetical protein